MSSLPAPPDSDDASGFRPVVVAATYNNAATMIGILERIERSGYDLIVVNDGATDDTPKLLAEWRDRAPAVAVHVVTHEVNRGKAAALHTGFAQARARGYTHAVTMDTDGQLEPEEIPRMVAAAERLPRALVLGRRSEKVPGLPRSNLVGWYTSGLGLWLEIGVVVNDSQCGLRVYPLELFDVVRCWAGRFGFEAEIIARAVWAGCPIAQVPATCHYPPRGEHVSHLKPWRDGAKGFFMHWGLALRRLVPWPEPKLSEVRASHPEPQALACAAPRTDHAQPHASGTQHGQASLTMPPTQLDVRAPKRGRDAWLQWCNPLSLVRQIRSSRLEQLIASAAFAHGVFMAFMPLGWFVFLVVAYGSRRLHHNLWAAWIGACLTLAPVGPALTKAAVTVGHLLTHASLPDFTIAMPGVAPVTTVFAAFPVSWCVGGVLLGTVAHWLTISILMLAFRWIPVGQDHPLPR